MSAFDQYVQTAEARMNHELLDGHPFLWVDDLPPAERTAAFVSLRNGEILLRARASGLDVPGGMIHDWMGIVFIPKATLDEALAQIQDYDDYARIYAPSIVRSKVLKRNGEDFTVSFRLQKKSFATTEFDVVSDGEYVRISPSQAYSDSHSTQITEVENPGTSEESDDPPGEGHGYLWRMNDYRRIREDSSGVFLQFEAIALSRDIPWGLEWVLKPFVTSLPRESLTFTLSRTRGAIEASEQRNRK